MPRPYPLLPTAFSYTTTDNIELQQLYTLLERWGSTLINQLNTRDAQEDGKPSTNIYSVTTVTTIKRPRAGDIAYSASTGKFKGYVSLGSETSWQNLN
jgi:hypothetical protein